MQTIISAIRGQPLDFKTYALHAQQMHRMTISCDKLYAMRTLLYTSLCATSVGLSMTHLRKIRSARPASILSAPSMNRHPREPWQDTAQGKKLEIQSKILQEWILDSFIVERAQTRNSIAGDLIEDLLEPKDHQITNLDAVTLVSAVADGSLSAVQVVTAFCKRAAYAHQLVCNFGSTEGELLICFPQLKSIYARHCFRSRPCPSS